MKDNRTLALRASQGHSRETGVDDDVLPVAEDVYYIGHATTRSAADTIVTTGLNRQQRNHIHFFECNRHGHLISGTVARKAEVLTVVSAAHARQDGINFYRSSNNVILSPGQAGVIAPKYFRYVYQLPRMNVLRQQSDEAETECAQESGTAALPSNYGFDQWFDEYDLFSGSEDEGLFDKSEEGAGSDDGGNVSQPALMDSRNEPPQEMEGQRERANPRFLRPRGNSPSSSDEERKTRRSRSPPVSTGTSLVTRPAYMVRSPRGEKVGKDRRGNDLDCASLITRPRENSPRKRIRRSQSPLGRDIRAKEKNMNSAPSRAEEDKDSEQLSLDQENDDDKQVKRRIEMGVHTDRSPSLKRLHPDDLGQQLRDLIEQQRIDPKGYYRSDGPGTSNGTSRGPTPPECSGWGPDYPGSSADVNVIPGWNQRSPMWGYPQQGFRTPQDDVMTNQWASLPNSVPVSPVITTRTVPVPGDRNTSRNALVYGKRNEMWNTPVGRPEPKRQAKTLKDRRTHGARVVAAVDSLNLWNRLDEENPIGPEDPTDGYSQEAQDIAKRGREMVQLAVETTIAAAQAKWRSKLRTHTKHGGQESDLHAEYDLAVENYKKRRRQALQ